MTDIANEIFEWKRGVVQKNLNKQYNGVTIKDLNNYKKCGRSKKSQPDDYFKLVFGNATPPSATKCICGQDIIELCYICPKDDTSLSKIIIVGNECINKWSDFSIKGRLCEVCNAEHHNRNFNLCNTHKVIK
jgi:hypothetical protein